MHDEMTLRMKNIISFVLSHPSTMLKEVATHLNISVRQVRYDIEKINAIVSQDIHNPIIETNNRGQMVVHDFTKLLKYNQSNDGNLKNERKERLRLLNVIIAFNISKLNLKHLSQQLSVSRATIKNDLKDIEEALKNYNLKLTYKSAFHIEGQQMDLAKYRMETMLSLEYTLYKNETDDVLFLMREYFQQTFVQVNVREMIPSISDFLEQEGLTIKDSGFYWLIGRIILMMWYSHNHIDIPMKKYKKTNILDIDFSYLFGELKRIYHVALTDEQEYEIKILLSNLTRYQKHNIKEMNINIIIFIFRLMNYIEANYNQTFYKDNVLIKALYNHIDGCIKKSGICIDGYELDEVKFSLDEKLDNLIHSFCKENKHLVGLTNTKDLDYIKLHFANSISRHYPLQKKKAIIVSGATLSAKEELKRVLEKSFELEIQHIISRFHIPFFEQWEKVDIILFTETIPDEFRKDLPTLKIHIVLNEEDLFQLNRAHIYPKRNTINLYNIYEYHKKLEKVYSIDMQDMDPWMKEQQILNLVYATYKDIPIIMTKRNIEDRKTTILHDNAEISFQQVKERRIEIYVDRIKMKIHLSILADQLESTFFYLFKYYYLLNSHDNLMKLLQKTDEEIITYLKKDSLYLN